MIVCIRENLKYISLSFFLPGIGVVSTTLRRKARPTTHCTIEWAALGLVQSMVQKNTVCPELLSWHPLPLHKPPLSLSLSLFFPGA